MGIRLFHVDAFADRPFAGNPAAVCLLQEEADATWMQAIAAEMNLSETAFVLPAGDQYQLYEVLYADGESAGLEGKEHAAKWLESAIVDGILTTESRVSG